MFILFLLNLFVILFNKTTNVGRKIYFELGENYELELNVSDINIRNSRKLKPKPKKKPRRGGMDDSALMPKHHEPRHKPLW
jgi:hypothetical protein